MFKKVLPLLSFLISTFSAFAQWQPDFVTDSIFRHPESAVYDDRCQCLYISNMDKDTPVDSLFTDFISKISVNGEVLELKWLSGMSSPSGLAMHKGLLYAVERNGVAVIDPVEKKIVKRIPIDTKGFLNDITVSEDGRIFVSEMEKAGRIFIVQNDMSSLWIEDTLLGNVNGLLVSGDYLYAGVNVDQYFKRIHLHTKVIEKIAFLGPGNIDGIQKMGDAWLVSHFLGNLYKVSADGHVEEWLNTRNDNIFLADFAFIPSLKLLVFPSLRTHKVYGYHIKD